jgi:PAS domain-containing protein
MTTFLLDDPHLALIFLVMAVAILYILIVNRRLRRYGRELKARQEELLRKTGALEAVSAEHRCEVERGERMDRTLQENEERTRTILNHIAEGVLTVDENGLIGFFNPAAERIFGYGPKRCREERSILARTPRGRHDGYIRTSCQRTGQDDRGSGGGNGPEKGRYDPELHFPWGGEVGGGDSSWASSATSPRPSAWIGAPDLTGPAEGHSRQRQYSIISVTSMG